MDYNKLFKEEAFKTIDSDILEKFKILTENIKNKTLNEAFLEILTFSNSLPKGKVLSDEEKNALVQTILISLPEKERDKFLETLELVNGLI